MGEFEVATGGLGDHFTRSGRVHRAAPDHERHILTAEGVRISAQEYGLSDDGTLIWN